jgi:hypothetical protein
MTLPLTFLCTPPLVWAAVRFRQREAAMLVAVLSGIAIWETLHGFGPLASVPTNDSLLLLQVFMGTVSVMAISAGAVVEERRRVEHEREHLLIREQAARAEAEAANRAKDEFLAMLGHELRNPLAAIISAVSVLDRIGGHDDVAIRAREAIRHQITHLGRLVDDLLDIVHVTTGEIALAREPLNLATSIQRAVSDLAGTGRLERHVVDVRAEPVWANADPTRLKQIVSNLLLNAIKYTSPGGTIDSRHRRGDARDHRRLRHRHRHSTSSCRTCSTRFRRRASARHAKADSVLGLTLVRGSSNCTAGRSRPSARVLVGGRVRREAAAYRAREADRVAVGVLRVIGKVARSGTESRCSRGPAARVLCTGVDKPVGKCRVGV